jgi:hypothetical protein
MIPGLFMRSLPFVLSLVCISGHGLAAAIPEPPSSIALEGMPSFRQRNAEFDGGGKKFCGPTAASNALMWLADHGYPNLKPPAGDKAAAQTEMIKRLAGFMGTYREGTSVASFANGIRSYLDVSGYSCKSWIYSGNSCANTTSAPPDINLVRALSSGNTVLWFSVGWYFYDESTQNYTRECGHWVTLAGYGKNREGKDDPSSFAIADPESPNAVKYVTLRMLDEGRITHGNSRANAKGYFDIVELDQTSRDKQYKYCILETIEAMTIE